MGLKAEKIKKLYLILVVSACRNLDLLLFQCVEEIEGKAPEP